MPNDTHCRPRTNTSTENPRSSTCYIRDPCAYLDAHPAGHLTSESLRCLQIRNMLVSPIQGLILLTLANLAWSWGTRLYCIIRNMLKSQTLIFNSPEPIKAQVSFSDQNLSVVRRRPRCCCRKLFTFSSSPKPLGQFQPNLAQSILGWRFKWRAPPFSKWIIMQ